MAYIARFGIAAFIKRQLTTKVNDESFAVMFDESMNKTTKNKQLDLHVRHWTTDKKGTYVCSLYNGSQFQGHSTAVDLLDTFKISQRYMFYKTCLTQVPNIRLIFQKVSF